MRYGVILRPGIVTGIIAFLAAFEGNGATPDKYGGSPPARRAYALGVKAQNARRFDVAIDAYQRAIKLDPNFASAYQKYFEAKERAFSEKNDEKPDAEQANAWSEFKKSQDAEMDALMARQPTSPVYPWINSTRYEEDAPEKQRQLCSDALALDPNFLPAYRCLAQVSSLGGDVRQAAEFYRRVLDAEPNAESWLAYTRLVRADPEPFRAAVEEVERRFPHSNTAAQALFIFATTMDRPADEIAALKKLIAEYSPARFEAANDAARRLFDLEDASDPATARELAHGCLKNMAKDADWKAAAVYADGMAAAERELAEGRPNEALEALKAIEKAGLPVDAARLEALRARVMEASGNAAGAYQLIEQAFARRPSATAASALYAIGGRLEKSRADVDKEVERIRTELSKPAKEFSLPAFTGGTVSLADYKGRVVMLDFWFPNCGPCRASFPYMRTLIDRYKNNKDVVFLAVNAIAGQEPFVMPLLRKEQIGWLPLKGNTDWCVNVYGVSAFPTTFLIGRDSKIYFKPHVRNSDGERSAEMAIDALLAMH